MTGQHDPSGVSNQGLIRDRPRLCSPLSCWWASRPLPVGGQESPQSSALTGPADSARVAKGNRKAAKRAAKEAEPAGEAPEGEELPSSERAGLPESDPARRREAPLARLIVTGAITRFGGEDRTIGGAGILKKALGGIGISRRRTIVELTAHVLDAVTGEVLLSLTGFGMSRKGGGLVAVGGT